MGAIVSDFGARRAHNVDAAVYGARAAFIGGVNGTLHSSSGTTIWDSRKWYHGT